MDQINEVYGFITSSQDDVLISTTHIRIVFAIVFSGIDGDGLLIDQGSSQDALPVKLSYQYSTLIMMVLQSLTQ